MKRLFFLAVLLTLPARAALTLDSTTCSSGTVTNCPHEHISGTAAYTSGVSAPISFPTPIGAAGAGTLLVACVIDENHGSGTSTGIPVVNVGTSANYSTAWTLVSSTSQSTTNGATACYYAIAARSFTGEVPTLTLKCTGGAATCQGTNASVGIETLVIVYGWSTAFSTPGNGVATLVGSLPSVSVPTSSGDRVLTGWFDNSGANCGQTLTANAAIVDAWAPPSATVVSGCNTGADDYLTAIWTTSTTSAGTTVVGTTAQPGGSGSANGVEYGLEICDSTASACPNSGTTQTGWWNWGAN